MLRVAPPELVSVTAWVELEEPTGTDPNGSWPGPISTSAERVVPINLITCGLPGALSEIVIVPVLVPAPVGVKMVVSVQLPPGVKLSWTIVGLRKVTCNNDPGN